MKIKSRPEDFRVEERSLLEPAHEGAFTLYRLEKRGVGTPEALRAVARRWRLPRKALSVSGLKDTHAHTGQMLTIRKGPGRNLDGDRWRLNFLGRSERPARRSDLVANRFSIVVRELADPRRFCARAEETTALGFPDYYDDQRFGSLRGTEGRFIATALLAGDVEDALRLALASPAAEDRAAVRRRRVAMRDAWGDWHRLADELPDSFERRVARRLAEGASFEDAYAMLDLELRRLHLSAYQAHLFNEELRRRIPEGPEWPGVEGPYRFPEGPIEDEELDLAVFEGLPFRAGRRRVLSRPEDLVAEPGESDATLRFELRPGSYATMLLKRCASGTTAP
jgi:tRNA pseudouridine13 synthase